MIRRLIPASAAVAMMAVPIGASAHHSFSAEFDPDTSGEVAGVVTQVRFTNPHVRYRIDVAGEDGTAQEWELQMSSPTTLRQSGWGPDSLRIGDEITARGQLGRDGAKKLYIRGVTMADGRELSVYGGRERSDPSRIDADPNVDYGYGIVGGHPFDISGAWRNSYKFTVTVDDLEPKPTPFTAEGRRVFEAAEHVDDPSLRCMAPGLPRIFGSPYNMEIVDAGSHYLVVHVERNSPRRIYMDGREPPENLPPTSLGFSVGHWEDDALVIETTHLLPGWLDGSGLPMAGDGTRTVERWQLAEDRLSMDRTLTIHDPYYTEPLVRRRGSARGETVEITEQPPCDPDSYYLDLLEAGRLEERLTR